MLTKFGAIVTDGRGKIGSFYIGKNHYGRFLAQWVVPGNPQTTFQQARRAQQAYLSGNWKNLTPTEQTDWERETANYPRTNSMGDTYFLTGQTLYIALNLNRWIVGEVDISSPVVKVIPPGTGTFSIVVDIPTTKFEITFAAAPTDFDTKYLVYTTDGLSAGIFYVSTKYRSTFWDVLLSPGTQSIWTEWRALYPSAVAGGKVFCKIVTINSASGNMGLPLYADTIIT